MVRFVKESALVENNEQVLLISGMCKSTDTKPTTGIATGSIMVEVDTGDVFFFDETGDWTKQFSFQS